MQDVIEKSERDRMASAFEHDDMGKALNYYYSH